MNWQSKCKISKIKQVNFKEGNNIFANKGSDIVSVILHIFFNWVCERP